MPRRVTIALLALPAALAAVLLWYESGYQAPHALAPGDTVTFPRLSWVAPLGLWVLWLWWVLLLLWFIVRQPGTSLANRLWRGTLGILALFLLSLYAAKWRGSSAFGTVLVSVVFLAPAGLLSIAFAWRHQFLRGPLTRARVVAALSLTLEVLLLVAAMAALAFPGHWLKTAELRVPDGRVFYVARDSLGDTFYSEESYALGHEISHSRFALHLRVLGQVYGHTSDIVMLRPARRPAFALPSALPLGPGNVTAENRSRGKLVLSADQQTLLFIHPLREGGVSGEGVGCNLAYDLARQQFSPEDVYSEVVVSPFALLAADDALDANDVAFLRQLRASGDLPTEAVFSGTSHPNPRVRALAKELLERNPSP